ncbi:hypothetical protein ACFYSW_28670 [Rhodococcus aetherivorans]|uniref:hypothetical protein n=1 Tax=Rhodococcus aetherivorans TaxID=191292 RepID=UPI0036B508FE
MKDGIDWAEVGAGGRFEAIVSVLLSTLYKNSLRIDGSGGDGGRDHQWNIDGKLILWQSKYFLRRLSEAGGRKKQIEDSLVTAGALQPDSWTLVTPMIPTPEELSWFEGLKAGYTFPLEWRGGDWLDAQLAEHPSIVRHFMSSNDEYIALLRELKQEEEAIVDGLPAAVGRIEKLAAKVDAANPFYTVNFTVDDGKITSTTLKPKYVGAEIDSPITIKFSFVAGTSAADQSMVSALQDALDWGEVAELPASHVRNLVIDAPHGLGAKMNAAVVRVGPGVRDEVDLALKLVLISPEGRQIAALPARLISRTRGRRGANLHGCDLTGAINARLRANADTHTLTLSLQYKEPEAILPSALLPALRFLKHATAPNLLRFDLGQEPSVTAVPLPVAPFSDIDALLHFVEGLERVQAAAGDAFPVPLIWTKDDVIEVERAVQLLDGHRVRLDRTVASFTMDDPKPFLDTVSTGDTYAIEMTAQGDYIATVCGHDLNLGPFSIYLKAMEVASEPESVKGEGYRISVHTSPDDGVEIALGEIALGSDGHGEPN